MKKFYPILLTVAGSDCSGGAGIQADMKTACALGVYAASVVTAVTSQDSRGFFCSHVMPPHVVDEQLRTVLADLRPGVVKVGMLGSEGNVRTVARALRESCRAPVVVDPVLGSTSGGRMLDAGGVGAMVDELFPLATLVTPNAPEAEALSGCRVRSVEEARFAARRLLACGAGAALVTGGHLPGDDITDVLCMADGTEAGFVSPRVATRNLHGTGCTLSSAIACMLALGHPLKEAVGRAVSYMHNAILAGADVDFGPGAGPVNHGYDPVPMHICGGKY